ncbi:MAG: hypothetical protein RLO04_05070 [Limnobacter sp.]|uniref:hypothetical protein n=1 Tax=Limnobacter sp. TaxID=2003368 RepID=UPI0032EC29EB
MDLERRFQIAALALKKLEDEHSSFMRSVSDLKQAEIPGAELRVNDNELQATCLGVMLTAKHRPIARNGEIELLEYQFAYRQGEKLVTIWRVFLSDGHLYEDVDLKNFICQSSNGYLPSRLAPYLGAALLQSALFAPGSDG